MKMIIKCMIAAFLMISCKEKKVTDNKDDLPGSLKASQTARDSADIRNVITGFYNWYNTNYQKLLGYKLYSSVNKKEGPPYKMNWDEVDRYQQFIRDSVPFLGDAFLVNQKRFFQQCDSAFKVDVNDDIPYGFDYDWYTNSQDDPKYLVDEVNKQHNWDIQVNGDIARAEVKGSYDPSQKTPATILVMGMQKENGKWTISRIGME